MVEPKQQTTDHAGALRLLASGAAWQCGETAQMLEDAADELERLRAALRDVIANAGMHPMVRFASITRAKEALGE